MLRDEERIDDLARLALRHAVSGSRLGVESSSVRKKERDDREQRWLDRRTTFHLRQTEFTSFHRFAPLLRCVTGAISESAKSLMELFDVSPDRIRR